MVWEYVKQALQILEHEQGTVIKDWGGRIPIALVYPNSYYVGMSNLGFQAIYGLLNSYEGVVCERAFASWQHSRKRDPNQNINGLSLETRHDLSDFAVLAFSISYELDYFNVVRILEACGIPPLAKDRDESYPLLIAGGPPVTANPEPLAPIFDCFAIGEAEAIIPNIADVLIEGVANDRADLLKSLSQIPGIYTPNYGKQETVKRQWAQDINAFSTVSTVLTPNTEFGEMYLMEISRGCNRGCRFCLAGCIFKPMRWRSKERILESAKDGMNYRKRFGLIGAAISDHPQIEDIVGELNNLGADISLSSLRIKPLSETVLKAIARGVTRTVTLAPEAGSERLRKAINKGISNNDILRAAELAADSGIKQLKLYFMIGLPTETDDDIMQLAQLVLAAREIIDNKRARTKLTVNVTTFIPKAQTPFQWMPMAAPGVIDNRISTIKSALLKKRIELKYDSGKWSLVQAALARGNAKLCEVLLKMNKTTLAEWNRATAECGLDSQAYSLRQIELDEKLPWDKIDSGTSKEKLIRELNAALA
ncbi:radical SAM protein [Chloroflexota bacterium]